MKISKLDRKYVVMADITGVCNARCKFCFNDWNCNSSNSYMSRNNYLKLIEILPHTIVFFYSCLFEPSLHPEFISFLKEIDPIYRDKVLFTTNLVRKFTDEEIDFLIHSGLLRINISIETFNTTYYQELTNTKNSYFYNNLERMQKCYCNTDSPVHLSFITLVMKDNYDEIIPLTEKIHSMFPKMSHEFRTPYFSPNGKDTFVQSQLLNNDKLITLSNEIQLLSEKIGTTKISCDFTNSLEIYKELSEKYFTNDNGAVEFHDQMYNDPFLMRVSADGSFTIGGNERINIEEIENPAMYFSNNLINIQSNISKSYYYETPPFENKNLNATEESSIYFIDECYEFNNRFLDLKGWALIRNSNMSNIDVYIMIDINEKLYFFKTNKSTRKDVGERFKNKDYNECGFDCFIDTDLFPLKEGFPFNIYFLFVKDNRLQDITTITNLRYDEDYWILD